MFWAAFGYGIRSDLVVMNGNCDAPRGGVTSKVYLQVLQENLPTILDNDSIFMHDNAGIHTAQIVQKWLEDEGIEVMKWPAYSPDLNPIENLWFLLKEVIHNKHPELATMGGIHTIDRLIEAAIEAWDNLKEDILNKLSITMENRCKAVLEANSWYTKY